MQLASITPTFSLAALPSSFSPYNKPTQSPPAFVKHDLHKAFHLLHRHPSVRSFMLDSSSTSQDVALLASPRPSFTIFTEEEQQGALPGRIALRYLGVPAFSNCAGLSGGTVVTSYTARTHPLHAPTVMADVRVGRYVRDNETGEWCILTRNPHDGIIRLQYIRVRHLVTRERICLTCSSELFDAGHFLASVLFQCHDREWRPCPFCGALPKAKCRCGTMSSSKNAPKGLAAVAETVASEGRSRWVGKVRVTVVSNLPRSRLLDIDACMDVTASYQPSLDSALSADMQRLAIYETAIAATVVPNALPNPEENMTGSGIEREGGHIDIMEDGHGSDDVMVDVDCADVSPLSSLSGECFENSVWPPIQDVLFEDSLFTDSRNDDTFMGFLESAILPADPSTLPGGTELCMDGMDLVEDWDFLNNCGGDIVSSTVSRESDDTNVSNVLSEPQDDGTSFVQDDPIVNEEQVAAVQSVAQIEHSAQSPPQENEDKCKARTLKMEDTLVVQPEPEQQSARQQRKEKYQPNLQQFPLETIPIQGPQSVALVPTPSQPVPIQMALPVFEQKQEDVFCAEVQEVADVKPQLIARGPRLAPRPVGMSACSDGFIWQMGNAYAAAAHLEAMEKERKAEERRKKNRQAAARSNARKKSTMDAYKAQIKQGNDHIIELRKKEVALKRENMELKRRFK